MEGKVRVVKNQSADQINFRITERWKLLIRKITKVTLTYRKLESQLPELKKLKHQTSHKSKRSRTAKQRTQQRNSQQCFFERKIQRNDKFHEE